MTKRTPRLALSVAAPLLLAFLAGAAAPARAAEHRLGLGVHYWRTIDDLADEGFGRLDEEGTSGLVSYQYLPGGLFGLQVDGEYFADGFGGSTSSTFSPQLYLVFSPDGLYAAAGVGVLYSDSFDDRVSDPFYAARIGWNLHVLPHLYLDVNANYRAEAWNQLKEADTDTITLGGVVRVGF